MAELTTYPSLPIAVANADDPARFYLYRPGELLVASRSEPLVTDRLADIAEITEVIPELEVVRFQLRADMDVPAFIDELLAEDESLQVGPNHVFWISEEEEREEGEGEDQKGESQGGEPGRPIQVPGLGLVGRVIDIRPVGVPVPDPALGGIRVSLIDTQIFYHPAFAELGFSSFASSSLAGDPSRAQPENHGTSVAGVLLLGAPGVQFTALPVTDGAGLADELQIGRAIVGAIGAADLICLPLGGMSFRDRIPVGFASLPMSDATVVVAAAGNHKSERPFWPAAIQEIVAVGAVGDDGRVVPWSGRGDWVDLYETGLAVAAPGPNGRWIQASGTSVAAAAATAHLARTMAEQGVSPREAVARISNQAAQRQPIPSKPEPRTPTHDADAGISSNAEPVAPTAQTETPEAAQVQTPLTPSLHDDGTPATEHAGPVAAGYNADIYDRDTLVEGATDTLRIRGDVDVLASVIASRQIVPPLSIGIFGDWGAGKSFLMNQLRLRVGQLAKASRSKAGPDGAGSYYCSEIVQIEFNAWQYADGQLWASLINRVFEGIRDHLGGDERYKAVLAAIERQDAEVRKAGERLAEAEKAANEVPVPTADRTVADVADAADDPDVDKAVNRFTEALGLDKDKVDLGEVAEVTRELQTLVGRLRKGWAAQGSKRRALSLSALVIGIALLAAATVLPPVSRLLVAVVGVLSPAIAVITQILKPTGDARRAGQRILRAGEREKQQYAEAKASYEQASAELAALRRQGPGGLYGFVEDRYRAEDYRKYLGMIPLIREDLRRLTEYTRRAGQTQGLERIVLYIDDLDRCPASQVVRVLEAVNLLFGFPLFVVVVAVDSRWLVQSLMDQFGSIFGAESNLAPSPQDYLQKIIQIPFWLRPMGTSGFKRLVSSLVQAVPANQSKSAAAAQELQQLADVKQDPDAGARVHDPSQPVVTSPLMRETDTDSGDLTPIPSNADAIDVVGGEEDISELDQPRSDDTYDIDLEPDTLVITPSELQFLSRLGPLIDTPRAAKRLVNTYQLVRVSVSDVARFLYKREYEPLLVLLAFVVSSPGLTAPMVRSLFASSSADLPSFFAKLDANSDDETTLGWLRLRDDLGNAPIGSVTAATVRQWLPTVSRFSFRPGLVMAADELATSAAMTAGSPAAAAVTSPGSAPMKADADPVER